MKPGFNRSPGRGERGFSLLELAAAIAIILLLAAILVPTLMTQVYAMRTRFSATSLANVLQQSRMAAAKRNAYYTLQPVIIPKNPFMVRVVDRFGAVVTTIQPAVMGQGVNVNYGTGSGAPGEAAFVLNSLKFVPAGAGTQPSFSNRGLPCVAAGGVCNPTVGLGFVFFLSSISETSGAVGWAAVAVTPSGRTEIWTYDGTNWNQQ